MIEALWPSSKIGVVHQAKRNKNMQPGQETIHSKVREKQKEGKGRQWR